MAASVAVTAPCRLKRQTGRHPPPAAACACVAPATWPARYDPPLRRRVTVRSPRPQALSEAMSARRLPLPFVLLLMASQAFGQMRSALPPAPASSAAAPEVQAPGESRSKPMQRTSLRGAQAGQAAQASVAPPTAPSSAPRAAVAGSAPGAAGSVSERARREAEHPYFWIRRNGELAYQRYAARVAQARAEGLPPPPTLPPLPLSVHLPS
eukprot:gene602-778_t